MSPDKDIRFYDTSSLLIARERLFNQGEKFLISSITLEELENIKTSNRKDEDTKRMARTIINLLSRFPEQYDVIIHRDYYEDYLIEDFSIWPDMRILADAIFCNSEVDSYRDRVIFVTNDLALKNIANLSFGDGMIESVEEEKDTYLGYKEKIFSDEELAEFY